MPARTAAETLVGPWKYWTVKLGDDPSPRTVYVSVAEPAFSTRAT